MLSALPSFLGAAGAMMLVVSLGLAALESKSAPANPYWSVSSKGDRYPSPELKQTERATVSTVELVGLSETVVILRDREGRLLYRSDPVSNTTLVMRDVDLPVVTVRETTGAPVVRQRVPEQTTTDEPSRDKGQPIPAGCQSAVSSLANKELARNPGLCLADAGRTISSAL